MPSVEQNVPDARDVPALTAVRAVLDQAKDEPDDAIAIRTGVGPDIQFRGLTWGELREVATAAEEAAGFRDWLARAIRHAEEQVVMATSDDASIASAFRLGALGSVERYLRGAR